MGAGTRGNATVVVSGRTCQYRLAPIASLFAFSALVCIGLVAVRAASAQAPNTTPPIEAAAQPGQTKPKNPATILWKRVPDAEKKVLLPLEKEWPTLPGAQQRKLLGAAKHYPSLTQVEQERFQERLRSWSTLTPEQRSAARDKFQLLNNLPKAKQAELATRWQQEKQAEKAAKDTPVATPVAK